MWEKDLGLLCKVGENYPKQNLSDLSQAGFDISGIKIVNPEYSQNYFYYIKDNLEIDDTNPIKYFNQLNQPIPKGLLDYLPPQRMHNSKENPTEWTIFPDSIPQYYLNCDVVYLGPLEFLSHRMLTEMLISKNIQTIILQPSLNYMHPEFISEIDHLVKGVDVIICSEKQIKNLFKNKITELSEMIDVLHLFGVEIVVIFQNDFAQILSTGHKKEKRFIPFYPTEIVDPIGAIDAFCGGFTAGFQLSQNPLKACLYGNVAVSFKVEYSGAENMINVLPQLRDRRMQHLASKVDNT